MAAGSTLAVTFFAAAAAAAAAVLITRWVDRRRMHRAYLEIEMVLDSFRNSSVHDAAGVDTLCEVSRRDIDRIKRQLKRIDSIRQSCQYDDNQHNHQEKGIRHHAGCRNDGQAAWKELVMSGPHLYRRYAGGSHGGRNTSGVSDFRQVS